MKLVIQRVKEASVTIDNQIHSSISQGLMVLVGVSQTDTLKDVEYAVNKLVQMRIFNDANDVMNLSIKDIDAELLVVSQFTLLAQTRKGNRPSYIEAARPEQAIPLYESFCELCSQHLSKPIQKGVFGADMKVSLINDGPVTIVLDAQEK